MDRNSISLGFFFRFFALGLGRWRRCVKDRTHRRGICHKLIYFSLDSPFLPFSSTRLLLLLSPLPSAVCLKVCFCFWLLPTPTALSSALPFSTLPLAQLPLTVRLTLCLCFSAHRLSILICRIPISVASVCRGLSPCRRIS